jgi:hypothetical protein
VRRWIQGRTTGKHNVGAARSASAGGKERIAQQKLLHDADPYNVPLYPPADDDEFGSEAFTAGWGQEDEAEPGETFTRRRPAKARRTPTKPRVGHRMRELAGASSSGCRSLGKPS